VQHVAERAGLAGQDDGEFVAVVLPGFGQDLVQAAEQVLAAVGQVVPGMCAGDHDQVPGDLDRVAQLRGGFLGGGAGQVDGGDLDHVPVTRDTQVAVKAGDRRGGAGLAGAGAAGEDQVLLGGPADRDAGLAAGLLGPQHRERRGEPPGDHLQARKGGQAARARSGGRI
jgi:hypothetical protein